MANVLGGGSKFHLAKYRGVFKSSKGIVVRLSNNGMAYKSCGGRYKGAFDFSLFHKYAKENPEWMCKKCLSRYEAMKLEAKEVKRSSEGESK